MSVLPSSPIALSLENAIDPNPLTVTPETLVLESIALMHQESDRCHLSESQLSQSQPVDLITQVFEKSDASSLLVVDQGELVGLLTERDLVRLAAEGMNLATITVAEVMTRQLITANKSELHDIFNVLNLFRQHRIRHLPILNETGQLVGMLSLEGMREALQAAYLLKLRRVAEIMTPEVIYTTPSASVREVAQLMNKHQISSVVICESEPIDNQLIPVGIITEKDIVQFHTLQLNLDRIAAETVMSTPVWSVGPEDSLWVVHQKMHSLRIRHLVVCQPLDTAASRFWRRRHQSSGKSLAPSSVKSGPLLGMVTQSSLMQVLDPNEMLSMIHLLQREVSDIEQEKIQLLNNCKTFLEQQVENRTAQIQEQADYQRLLATVAQRIRQSLNLEEILTTTVKEVRQILACDRVLIYQCNGLGADGLMAESVNGDLHPSLDSIICDSCRLLTGLSSNCHNGIRVIGDIYNAGLHPLEISGWEELGFRAGLLVPIIKANTEDRYSPEIRGENTPVDNTPEYWGFLIAGEYDSSREWQPSQVELLEQLATQLAIAIQQSTLLSQVRSELEERQQAEQALAQEHNFVSAILDVIGALVVVLDCEGQILKFNQACEQTTGYRFEEVVGEYIWDLLLLPDEIEAVRTEFHSLKAGEFPNHYQNYWLTKNQQRRLIAWSNTCLTNEDGQVEYVIATGIDVTEQKQAELALKHLNEELELRVEQRTTALQNLNQELEKEIRDRQQAEIELQRLLSAVEAASDGIGILTDEKYRYLNRAHVELFGYDKAEELIGTRWQELYSPDEQERLHRNIFPILKQQQYWRGEAIAKRKDGSTFAEELSLTWTDNGDFICVCQNIDHRKKMEKALRNSEARFRGIFEQAAVGITLLNLEGNFLKFNQKLPEILGYRSDEIF
jgi:PAS domain S-box-containing protein